LDGKDRKSRAVTPEQKENLRQALLKRDYCRYTPKTLLELLKRHDPSFTASVATVRREMGKIKKTPEYLFVADQAKYKSTKVIKYGTECGDVERPNQVVQLDGTTLDIFIWKNGRESPPVRMTGVMLIDRFTRRFVIVIGPSESAELTKRCFLKYVRLTGALPDKIITDRGKGFGAGSFAAGLEALGVEFEQLPGGSPELKGTVERAWGTVNEKMQALPGWTGANVAQAQKLREQMPFGKRTNRDTSNYLTLEEAQKFLDDLAVVYHNATHTGLGGLTPNQKAASQPDAGRKAPETRDLAWAFYERGIRVVGTKGIQLGGTRNNPQYFRKCPELMEKSLMGQRVRIYQDPDGPADQIAVRRMDGSFLCLATTDEFGGATREEYQTKKYSLEREVKGTVRQAAQAFKGTEKWSCDHMAEEAERLGNIQPLQRTETDPSIDLEFSRQAADAAEAQDRGRKDAGNVRRLHGAGAAGNANNNEEPQFFEDFVERYDWLRKQKRELTQAESDFIREFESSDNYQVFYGDNQIAAVR